MGTVLGMRGVPGHEPGGDEGRSGAQVARGERVGPILRERVRVLCTRQVNYHAKKGEG